ncbi:MAG: hypothetical protein AAFY98_00805 [Verrucomicrobiota bacterium]
MNRTLPFLFVLIGLVSACSSPSKVADDPRLIPGTEEVATAFLQGESLAQKIQIQDQSYSYDENSIFLGETLIYNQAQIPVSIEVRTLFKDPQNRTLTTTPWKTIEIGPSERYIYVAPSASRETYKFITHIKPAGT